MRSIDADALKAHYSWWKGGTAEKTLDEMKTDFDTIIDLQPTIDPVKHGRWKKIGHIENALLVSKCSECGYQTIDAGSYCSSCGAKMDADVADKPYSPKYIPLDDKMDEVEHE